MVRKLEQYLADDAKREDDDRPIISRSEERREKQRVEAVLLGVAKQLSEMKPKHLEKLAFDDHLLSILDELKVINDPAAKMRAMKRLRGALRDADIDILGQRIAALLDPQQRPVAAVPDAAALWCQRLRDGSDKALDEFVQEFPSADRAQLRTLARNLLNAAPNASQRAIAKLSQAVRAAMRNGSAVQPHDPPGTASG
ncbi:MAG TPA: DUF615 domain-containing protein [Polyangiaceae bacterium]